jgi:hypothetical protein
MILEMLLADFTTLKGAKTNLTCPGVAPSEAGSNTLFPSDNENLPVSTFNNNDYNGASRNLFGGLKMLYSPIAIELTGKLKNHEPRQHLQTMIQSNRSIVFHGWFRNIS